MSPLPDEQPLSRRQLREQQRTTDVTPETPSRRVSTTSPVPAGQIPDVGGSEADSAPVEPALTTDQVKVLEDAAAEGKPLTRRQARDLERVRTASLAIVPPLVEPAGAASASTGDSAVEDKESAKKPHPASDAEVAPSASAGEVAPAPKPSRFPAFVPASAVRSDVIDDESIVPADSDNASSASTRNSFGLPVAEREPGLAAFTPDAIDSDDEDAEPRLSSSFGEAVLDPSAPKREQLHSELDQPFDQIIARGLEEAGNGVGTSSLILPTMPSGDPFTGPLSAQGGVVVTGSIDIPSGNGSTGSHPNSFDKSDIDAMFDEEDESRPATAGTPVSASRAVSTHTATRDVITPPAPARSNRLLLILAITAGVLAVAVLSVIIVGIAAGAFQSQ